MTGRKRGFDREKINLNLHQRSKDVLTEDFTAITGFTERCLVLLIIALSLRISDIFLTKI